MKPAVAAALRLVLVTDGRGDADRLRTLVAAAVAGGVRCVQLREPTLSAAELSELCRTLRPRLAEVGGLLLVNDRADLAAARRCDGVHLGHRSLPVADVRGFVPADAVIGFSAHDGAEAESAAAAGADYVSLSPVFATASKPGVEPLGVQRTAAIAAGVPVPSIWLGGIDAERVRACALHRPAGVAVMGAICSADDPRAAAASLDRALADIGRPRR